MWILGLKGLMPYSPYVLDMINAATMTMDLQGGLITEDHLAIMTLTWTDALLTQETMDILGMVVVMVTEAAVLQGLLQGTIIVSALFLYLPPALVICCFGRG